MPYNSLVDFVQVLTKEGELRRILYPVKAELEVTEIADRVVKAGGPALLFENVVGGKLPVLINAYGSQKRMALAVGCTDVAETAAEAENVVESKPRKPFKEKP